MAKVKTKGVPILFRPPIHISDHLIKMCAEEGISPNAYVERLLVEDITPKIPKPRGRGTKPFLGRFGGSDGA